MKPSDDNHKLRIKDIDWYMLGEYSLDKILPDPGRSDKLTAGELSQTVRELGLPVECIENIEMKLKSLASEVPEQLKQANVELPRLIRIFCQKKMIEEETKGGWGYFVIESSWESTTSDGIEPHLLFDLYLYKEGE